MDFKFVLQLFSEGGEGKGNPAEGGDGGKPPTLDPEPKKVDTDSEEFKNELNKQLEATLAERLIDEKSKWEKEFKKKAEHEKKNRNVYLN